MNHNNLDPGVLAKKEAAIAYCGHASGHAATCGGKSWAYALIPHDAIAENQTLENLVGRYAAR